MHKPLIRPIENAYPDAPFFHLAHRTDWVIPYFFTTSLILALGSCAVYGYGAMVHTLALQVSGMLFVTAIGIFNKRLFFNSILWNAELLVLAALLPVNLPWYTGLIAAPLYIIGARLLLVPETRLLFQPHALILVFLLRGLSITPSPTVFHLMPDMGFLAWMDASRALFLGEALPTLREIPLILGGPGGSVLLVLTLGLLLSSLRVISFSSAFIYIAVHALWLLFPWGKTKILTHIPDIVFCGFFLLQNPIPLEYPKKLLHAFMAASFGILLSGAGLNLYLGILAANLCTPFLDTFTGDSPPDKKQARLGRVDSLITGSMALCLAAAAYFLSRIP